jgi:hypothetical protein
MAPSNLLAKRARVEPAADKYDVEHAAKGRHITTGAFVMPEAADKDTESSCSDIIQHEKKVAVQVRPPYSVCLPACLFGHSQCPSRMPIAHLSPITACLAMQAKLATLVRQHPAYFLEILRVELLLRRGEGDAPVVAPVMAPVMATVMTQRTADAACQADAHDLAPLRPPRSSGSDTWS